MDHTIKIECSACKGTGLYVGMCEKDGAAVICYQCKGKGAVLFSYNEPPPGSRPRRRDDVVRVFDSTHGYVISANDVVTKEGVSFPFSQYGCTYEDWYDNGAVPKEMVRLLRCPANNAVKDRQGYEFCIQGPGDYIPKCPLLCEKDKCWETYDRQLALEDEVAAYKEKAESNDRFFFEVVLTNKWQIYFFVIDKETLRVVYMARIEKPAAVGRLLDLLSGSFLDDTLSQEDRDKLHEEVTSYRNRAVFLLKTYKAYDLEHLKRKREESSEETE